MKIYSNFYPLWISFRFIVHSTKAKYTKVITLATIMGITIGIATLLTVMSIMNGFSYIAKSRVTNLIPHISLNLTDDYDLVSTEDEFIKVADYDKSTKLNAYSRIVKNKLGANKIEDIYPSFFTKAFIVNNQKLIPIYINALPTNALEQKITALNNNQNQTIDYTSKTYSIADSEPDDTYGDDTDKKKEITKKYIKGIVLSSSIIEKLDNANNVSFADTTNILKFYNSDIVASFYAADPVMSNIALIDLEYAKELFPDSNLSTLNVKLVNPNNAVQYAQDIMQEVTLTVNNWTQFIGNYFNILEYTKQIMFILLSCIVIVSMFNAVSTITTTLNEKQAEIAILKTIGSDNFLITKIFMLYGFILTTIGVVLGLSFGLLLSSNVSFIATNLESLLGYKFINPKVYFIDYLPAKILLADIFNITTFVYFVMLFAMIYPVRKAIKITPIQALKFK